jgi:fructosamine-3-kinase
VPPAYPPILDQLGRGTPVDLRGLGGGCIADAAVARFADGTRVFVKRAAGQPGMFAAEAAGLGALEEAGAIRIPRVLAVSEEALVLEMIEAAPRKRGFFEDFGRRFAGLHRHRGKACGFPGDNFIGSTPQPNRPLDGAWEDAAADDGSGWPGFFLERRLRYQIDLAGERGRHELAQLFDRAESRILDLLSGAQEPPVILHGDLWGGNFIVDEHGDACLIDPAVYYGHREADLAMTRLFGGFDSAFYAAYDEALPLAPGHAERLPIYQLYHVLNHFNLFGGGYYEQGRQILMQYVRR